MDGAINDVYFVFRQGCAWEEKPGQGRADGSESGNFVLCISSHVFMNEYIVSLHVSLEYLLFAPS